MPIRISSSELSSFAGDVLPLYLTEDVLPLQGDVTWALEGDCVALRHFDKDGNTPFTNGVLVTMLRPGNATVSAHFSKNTYTCRVCVRKRAVADATTPLQYFRGDLHVHPGTTHTPEKYAATERIQKDCISQLAADPVLDFSVLSDHACVMYARGFFDNFVEKELAEPTLPVLFPGSESEVTIIEPDRFGIEHQHSGEMVILNADNCSFGDNWADFTERMAQSPSPVGIFAHPLVFGADGLWSYPFEALRTPELYRIMRGVEMGRGSLLGYDILYEYAYAEALDNGFAVSPTCGSDCHGPKWGFDSMPAKTVAMASEKSKEALLDALLCGRFYACESGNVKLGFTVNGAAAPATLSPTDTYRFHITLSLFDERPDTLPTYCEVISDYGEVIYTCEDLGHELDFELRSDTARYFYLRLVDAAGRRTWSAPVWTGRAIDPPKPPKEEFIPLDGAAFTAVDTVTGLDASAALTGLPSHAFESTASTARIVIDMKTPHGICAIGHWGKHVSKAILRERYGEWKTPSRTLGLSTFGGYATRYAVSTSEDGVQWTLRKQGCSRSFADEEILAFDACTARFVAFEILSTVGKDSGIPALREVPVNLGALTLFTK